MKEEVNQTKTDSSESKYKPWMWIVAGIIVVGIIIGVIFMFSGDKTSGTESTSIAQAKSILQPVLIRFDNIMGTESKIVSNEQKDNTIETNGSLYPLGTIAGMTVYVDPNMIYSDTRVLVGRKGAADEPGTVFCPYLMAESVKLITEGTGAPKVIIKSRYALVDAGFHPETQYLTLYIKTTSGII